MKDLIVQISQGNPGCTRVLCEIYGKDPVFLNPLGIAMLMTKSKGYGIWIVYKDVCNHDLDKTMEFLREWFDNETMPLEEYLEEKGFR